MIAYYAHSQGYGHANYAQLLARQAKDKLIVLTSSDFIFDPDVRVVHLENEDRNENAFSEKDFGVPGYLHHAPLGMPKMIRRNQKILQTLIDNQIRLVLVDVSVEVATLLRVSCVPYTYKRMMGNRTDAPHRFAYEGAAFLIAYYPKEFEPKNTLDWIVKKTLYLGFVAKDPKSAIEIKAQEKDQELKKIQKPYVLLLQGLGGNNTSESLIEEIALFFHDFTIRVVGAVSAVKAPENVAFLGIVHDTGPYIQQATHIIAACGSNTVSEILSYNRNFLILPEERPYDEQQCFAEVLEENQIGVIYKPGSLQDAFQRYILLRRTKQNFSPFFGAASKLYQFFKAHQYDVEKMYATIQAKNTEVQQN